MSLPFERELSENEVLSFKGSALAWTPLVMNVTQRPVCVSSQLLWPPSSD
jgi:hypothetical protein